MHLFQSLSRSSPPDKQVQTPYVTATELGIEYGGARRRDDFQSIAYRTLFRREKPAERFWALKGVNLSVKAGEILGVIGPNGAGKSTLCKVIAGILRPDVGTLEVQGKVFSLLSVGTGFNRELSGRENVVQNGMMLGMSRREVEALLPDIIQYSGLERFIDQPLKRYSSGMRSRLGFSVAAMVKPQILILDETLSVGDHEFTHKAAEKMQELVQQASVVIVVTHQVDFVSKYCSKAIWMERGQVKQVGAPNEIVPAYRSSIPARTTKRVTHVLNLRETLSPSGTEEVASVSNLGVKFSMEPGKAQQKNLLHRVGRAEPFWALKDVTFNVCQGDILGIIGRNGAGKTTLCRVLSGILRPDTGMVRMLGKTSTLLSLGAGFNDQLTGRDNIFLNGMMLGLDKARVTEMYDEIVAFSELNHAILQPLKQYSSGMRSRLAFSIAATMSPDIFIVDEALAVGDMAFYEKASAKMQAMLERAKAVVLVTHDMSFVRKVCNRAIWLDRGTVRFDGNPNDAVAQYHADAKY